MKIEWAKRISDIAFLEDAETSGFEHLHAVSDLSADSREEMLLLQKERFLKGGIPFSVCDLPLPREVQFTQKGFNLYVWAEFLKKRLSVLTGLGCKIITLSNGRARLLPVEGSTQGLKEQMLQFLFILCEIAEPLGIMILVEPLSPRRTNFLNSLSEVEEFINLVDRGNIYSLVSLRELQDTNFPLSGLEEYAPSIKHIQLENPLIQEARRRAPRPDDGYDYRPLFEVLKRINYSGLISLPEDSDAESLLFCRGLAAV